MMLARRLSLLLAAVSAVTGTTSFVFWRLFSRDVPAGIGNLRGTALTLVVLVLPAMLIAMRAAGRGSLRGAVAWLACLAYIGYNAVMFCFAAHFNAMFLPFVAMLALSFWSIVTLVPSIDRVALARSSGMPVRAISVYLLVCSAVFASAWLGVIVPATLKNEMPTVITDAGLTQNTVWVLDLAFTFPLMLTGALWLWRRTPWGYLLGGMMVLMLTLETAGGAVDQWFGHLHDPNASLGAVPIMIGFTIAGSLFSTLYLRGVVLVASGSPRLSFGPGDLRQSRPGLQA